MNRNLMILVERREQLVAKASAQRAELAQYLEMVRTPLSLADRAVAVFRYFSQHPALLLGVSLAFGTLLRRYTRKWTLLPWAGLGLRLARSLLSK